MRLTRLILVPAAAGALLLAGVSAASAGEITGNGKPTPNAVFGHSASICSFSGQNDEPDAPGPEGGRVQNFGHVLKFVKSMGGSMADLKAEGETPGAACNGNRGIVAMSGARG